MGIPAANTVLPASMRRRLAATQSQPWPGRMLGSSFLLCICLSLLAAPSLAQTSEATVAAGNAAQAATAAAGKDDDDAYPKRKVNDPFETLNRRIFSFNDALDSALIKPVATAYDRTVPDPVKTGVGNFFANIWDIWTAANQLLQGKPSEAAESLGRVLVNTTVGLAGLVDVASELGIERRSEDFGQTLGVWGVPAGPYIVLPVLGPSTLRDTAVFPVDNTWFNQKVLPHHTGPRYALLGMRGLEARRSVLPLTRMLDEMTVDKYLFVRDVHLKRRLSQVYDGNPPEEEASLGPGLAVPVSFMSAGP